MKLIVGLGNPGQKYADTRHNAGFWAVDVLADRRGWRFNQKRAQSLVAEGTIDGERVIVAKPQTLMNNSGSAVSRLLQSYRVAPANLLVIYDDIDLDTGIIRMRARGGPGTHNGMRSIVQETGTPEFARLRIGIAGARGSSDLRDYVLAAPIGEDAQRLREAAGRAADAATAWIHEGSAMAMNQFNG